MATTILWLLTKLWGAILWLVAAVLALLDSMQRPERDYGSLAGIFGIIGALFGGMLLALLLGQLPSCQQESSPVAAMPEAEAPTKPIGFVEEVVTPMLAFHPLNGEGCIAVTRRGGHELSLPQCVALARSVKLKAVRNARGLIEAPRVAHRDTFTYHDGGWTLTKGGK